MRRSIQDVISLNAVSYAKYFPILLSVVKSWPTLLLDYIGITNSARTYILRNGFKITTGDGISSGTIVVIFVKKDYGEVPESNSIIIDIGANIGCYSLYAAQSEGTKIYAFEPMPENFALLQENVKQNNLEEQIKVFPYAVSGEEEERTLYLGSSPLHSFLPIQKSPFHAKFSQDAQSQEQESITVPCISLQQVFDDNNIRLCDLLKIDCEGGEYDILYNLPAEYYKRISHIRMEYHNHLQNDRNTGKALIQFLTDQGFKIVKIKKGSEYQGDIWLERL